jgi:hypothetical protein
MSTIPKVKIRTRRLPNGKQTVETPFGDVSMLRPREGGELSGAGPVVLVSGKVRDRIITAGMDGKPYEFGGTQTTIQQDRDGDRMTITASNGCWTWKLLPARWPDAPDGHGGWWLGIFPQD